MIAIHRLRHRIRFAETDATGFAYFGSYIRLVEETEYSFLRSRGLGVVVTDERGTVGFPRLDCTLRVIRPAQFGDEVEVRLKVSDIDGKQIGYEFEMYDRAQDRIAHGHYRVACCRFPAAGLPFAILMPTHIHERLTTCQTPLWD